MEVKNRKTYFKPYNKINDRHVIIMWDYKPITKTNAKGVEIETPLAVWQEYSFDYVPTLSEIKNVILSYYNKLIENEIVTGFTWNGMRIWLSTENQMNYKNLYDMTKEIGGSNLPIKLKFGDNDNVIYYEFRSVEEFSDFYIASVNHIQKTIIEGWEKKDKIDWNFYL